MKQIIPAILTDQLEDAKEKLKKLEGVTKWIQFDVMDGKFAPKPSLSFAELKTLIIPFQLELHLMVLNPERHFKDCEELGARRVIFHIEAVADPAKTIEAMKKYSFQRGVALNLKTSAEAARPYLENVDLVQVLTVNPGLQGQELDPRVLPKIRQLRAMSKNLLLEVDGGVRPENIYILSEAGADIFVVGSYLVKASNVKGAFSELESKLR